MPRAKRKLTLMKDGRWRKIYKGYPYYFVGKQAGETLEQAYQRAWGQWSARKVQLDALPLAEEKRVTQTILAYYQGTASNHLTSAARQNNPQRFFEVVGIVKTVEAYVKKYGRITIDDPQRIAEAPWEYLDLLGLEQDEDTIRPAMRGEDPIESETSLEAILEAYKTSRTVEVEANRLTFATLQRTMERMQSFVDFAGPGVDVAKVTSAQLEGYREKLTKDVGLGKIAERTANDLLAAVSQLYEWCRLRQIVDEKPRIIAEKKLKIRVTNGAKKIEVFSIEEVKQLIGEGCTDRTRLFFLLMLNCGFLQADIANLQPDEVDWKAGRIIRKRWKTRQHASVPEVEYLLWPATFKLLKECRSKDKDRVLVTVNGDPLAQNRNVDGHLRQTDNIKEAYYHRCKQLGIEKRKAPKTFRKTSASLLGGHKEYRSLDWLFLGHSPKTIADKHYVAIPQELLDEAVTWLGKQYGVVPAN